MYIIYIYVAIKNHSRGFSFAQKSVWLQKISFPYLNISAFAYTDNTLHSWLVIIKCLDVIHYIRIGYLPRYVGKTVLHKNI